MRLLVEEWLNQERLYQALLATQSGLSPTADPPSARRSWLGRRSRKGSAEGRSFVVWSRRAFAARDIVWPEAARATIDVTVEDDRLILSRSSPSMLDLVSLERHGESVVLTLGSGEVLRPWPADRQFDPVEALVAGTLPLDTFFTRTACRTSDTPGVAAHGWDLTRAVASRSRLTPQEEVLGIPGLERAYVELDGVTGRVLHVDGYVEEEKVLAYRVRQSDAGDVGRSTPSPSETHA